MERTVVLKREDSGFGFTLTKEMPVFVDKVFNGGAAQKAGMQPNDRILKASQGQALYNDFPKMLLCVVVQHVLCSLHVVVKDRQFLMTLVKMTWLSTSQMVVAQ